MIVLRCTQNMLSEVWEQFPINYINKIVNKNAHENFFESYKQYKQTRAYSPDFQSKEAFNEANKKEGSSGEILRKKRVFR